MEKRDQDRKRQGNLEESTCAWLTQHGYNHGGRMLPVIFSKLPFIQSKANYYADVITRSTSQKTIPVRHPVPQRDTHRRFQRAGVTRSNHILAGHGQHARDPHLRLRLSDQFRLGPGQ